MKHGNMGAARWTRSLRIAVVLLTLTALVVLSGCALRSHSRNGQPAQQATGQQAGGQSTGAGQTAGTGSAAQQVENADQQIQSAMQGIDNAQNDANNADSQSSPSTNVP